MGILGALGFFVWLASVQVDRQFQRYYIYLDSVSGLSQSAQVRYNGLPVGQVVNLGLDPADSRVRVLIEVAADTPVRDRDDRATGGPGRHRRLLRFALGR